MERYDSGISNEDLILLYYCKFIAGIRLGLLGTDIVAWLVVSIVCEEHTATAISGVRPEL
jgi:hypothetical protein